MHRDLGCSQNTESSTRSHLLTSCHPVACVLLDGQDHQYWLRMAQETPQRALQETPCRPVVLRFATFDRSICFWSSMLRHQSGWGVRSRSSLPSQLPRRCRWPQPARCLLPAHRHLLGTQGRLRLLQGRPCPLQGRHRPA